jgi:hypothetical protein
MRIAAFAQCCWQSERGCGYSSAAGRKAAFPIPEDLIDITHILPSAFFIGFGLTD